MSKVKAEAEVVPEVTGRGTEVVPEALILVTVRLQEVIQMKKLNIRGKYRYLTVFLN